MEAAYAEAFKEQALAKMFRHGDRTSRAVADDWYRW